ncbi:MAG: rhomboid family intramembrane serine protease [Prevotellaceae bacterium]|nr:rhomboid family intramembrane serine protease [Candidatus Colivivens caballi]
MMTKAVKYLLIINIVAYIVCLVMPIDDICGLYYIFSPEHKFHIFQPLTYMFMHGGVMHLFFNMFALWMFGRIIEQAWGTRQFVIYYLICGIGAALVQEIGQMAGLISPFAMTVGASGAIYGVLLAFGMLYPDERMFIIPIPFPIKAKYFVMGYAVIEIFEGLTMADGVAHFAHLGGMLFGFIYIMWWKKRQQRQSSYYTGSTGSGWGFGKSSSSTRPDIKVEYNREEKAATNYSRTERERDYDYNAERQQANAEIDRILDKVRQSGYTSLTEEEKIKLFDAGSKK